jgi:hypothetical protein
MSIDCAAAASQKVALSALGKRRMKNVDKNIDENNKQLFGCLNATQSDLMSIFHGIMTRFPTQIIACCAYRCSYLRVFHTHFDEGLKVRLFGSPHCFVWDGPIITMKRSNINPSNGSHVAAW